MKNSHCTFSIRWFLVSTVNGFCLGIAAFVASLIVCKSALPEFRLEIGVFAGALVFTSYECIKLFILCRKLSASVENLKEQSSTDNLTELYNRNYLEPFLENEIDAAKKENQKVSLIMVDMDHFKEINDTYGHIVGDHILTIFAQVVLKCIRKSDIIARYGGDEFIVVLPNTDTETAEAVAERIREDVSSAYIPPIDDVVVSSIHCSVGISTYPVHCDSKNSLLRTSDLALYMAKRSGRNCIKVYQSELLLS